VELRDDGDNVIERANVPGVAWVKSDSLAVQYWNDPGQSGKAFRDGWFCTGDIFTRTAEGLYSHQGRSDERLKISSQWVSPSEIENQALKHPEVLDAAVVGVPNPDGLTRLAIFLTGPKTEAERERVREEVTRDMLDALSVYKCPRRFVFLDELPRTATGKIQRYVLREQAANQIKWT
jgi:benzoate-CoA ligase